MSVSVVLLGGSSPMYRRQRPVAVALASTWLKGGAGHFLLNFQSPSGCTGPMGDATRDDIESRWH